jgi:CheY-like chemotaxis protein
VASVILYVDDDPVSPALEPELERRGHRLVQTQDPEEALRLVASGEPVLVFLEPLIAGCDGFALLQEVGALAPELPVVVVTRGHNPRVYPRAVESGCRDFLSKPVLTSQLLACAYDLAGRPPERPVDARQELPSASAAESELAGAADGLGFAELLRELHEAGFSGVVIVSGGELRVGVELRNGTPVAASAKAGRERLEDFLLRRGRLSQEQHDRVIDQIAGGLGRAEEILVASDFASEEEIRAARAEQGREIALEPFGWPQAKPRLLPGKRLKADTALPVEAAAHELLLQGALEHSGLEQVAAWLDRSRGLYVSCGARWERKQLALAPDHDTLVRSFRGDRTLAETVTAGEVEPRVLYALALAGALDLHADPGLPRRERVEAAVARHAAPETRAPAAPEPAASRPAAVEPPAAPVPPPVRPLRERVRPAEGGVRAGELERRVGELGVLIEQLEAKDAFGVLEVDEQSSDEDVQRSYQAKLALEFLSPPAALAGEPALADAVQKVRDRYADAYRQLRTAGGRRVLAALRRSSRSEPADAERARQAEGWFRKGAVQLEARDYAKAIEALGMAAHLDPQQGEYLCHLGYALFLSNPRNTLVGREAMEQMAKGIKLSPDRPLSYVFLGRALKATDDLENARRMFRRALKIDPDFHPARQELRALDARGGRKPARRSRR